MGDLTTEQHKVAKQHIFNDGPIVGFISATAELAACARDDRIIYETDCDGDGILDHWCYIVGDAETPTYEAFISSRRECQTVERSCRRSVLPGRHFGCQRPLGWCMHGEEYRRDVDCDGDGHFDHVC